MINRKFALALVIAASAAGNAFADDLGTYNGQPFTSTLSHAEVQNELAQYKQAGVNPWSTSYNPLRGFQSTRSREQVVAEYLQSRNEVAAMTGEDSGAVFLASGQQQPRSILVARKQIQGR